MVVDVYFGEILVFCVCCASNLKEILWFFHYFYWNDLNPSKSMTVWKFILILRSLWAFLTVLIAELTIWRCIQVILKWIRNHLIELRVKRSCLSRSVNLIIIFKFIFIFSFIVIVILLDCAHLFDGISLRAFTFIW